MNLEIIERINAVKEHRLPAGYRHPSSTDSVLPADWPDCQIKDIVKQVIRPVARPDKPYWRLGLRSHAKGTFHEWVEEPEKVEMGTLFEVKENDLILNITFAWEHAVGLIQKKDEICLVSHRFPTYEFINGNVPEFFFAVVCQPWFKKMLADISPGGAGRNRVMSKPNFLCLPCFCPPLQEQQKIAEILSACERVLTLKKELKAQKIKQKKWLMQKLLNPLSGVRLPGFKEKWEKSSLGKRVKTFSGGTPRRDYPAFYGGNIPWIKSGELNLLRIRKTEEYITEDGLVNSSAKMVKPGTLLLALYGATAGVLAISEIEAAINQAILALVPDLRLSSSFLFYYLSYIVPEAVKLLSQGAQPNLNAEVVKNLQISYPSLSEQTAIAEVLSAADRELDLLEEEIQAWKRKKKALSQLLLRGIVRV